MRVISIVGMAGSGKSEVARVFEANGYGKVRFGDVTDREIMQRGLKLNEENERFVRQQLRAEHGMAAYAELSLPEVDRLLKSGNVIIDGLYSWEEFKLLKNRYGDGFTVLAVWSSPRTRYDRLSKRQVRPLTEEEAVSRDLAEIENINKGGPIAMADLTIMNESSLGILESETKRIVDSFKRRDQPGRISTSIFSK